MAERVLVKIVTGPLDVNTYIAASRGGSCLVVDPGDCLPVSRRLQALGCKRVVVVVTHGHFDHIGGVDCIVDEFSASLAAHPLEPRVAREGLRVARMWSIPAKPQRAEPRIRLEEGSLLEAGGLRLRVYHTPGHSPDHLVLHDPEAGLAFTGDLVFAGTVGRVDLPGANGFEMVRSLERIASTLPPATRLLPGHGPETLMARELEWNPFLRDPSQILGGLA